MMTGKGINPYNPRGVGVEGVALNVSMVGATLTGNYAATGMPTNAPQPLLGVDMSAIDVQ